MKKIFIFTLFFIANLMITNKIFAANLSLSFPDKPIGIGEQFYVDLILDPKGESVNTIKGSIKFPNEGISFVRVEEGKSVVNLWVEKPELNLNNTISFAGVMTNGFSGVTDPFNTKYKLPGLIIRIIFEAKKSGQINFLTSPFILNLNDGLGTETQALPIYISTNIKDYANEFKYENKNDGQIELNAYVIRDPNIFDNKYTLIFNAKDKETGIKNINVKEGNGNWEEAESPYLLKDQTRRSAIYVQAVNLSGVNLIKKIDPLPYWFVTPFNVAIFVVVCFSLFILIRKIYKRKNFSV